MLWWLDVLMKYVVGGGGLVWELLIDRLQNAVALIVFGALATSTDVIRYVRTLVEQAREEKLAVNDALEELRDPDTKA